MPGLFWGPVFVEMQPLVMLADAMPVSFHFSGGLPLFLQCPQAGGILEELRFPLKPRKTGLDGKRVFGRKEWSDEAVCDTECRGRPELRFQARGKRPYAMFFRKSSRRPGLGPVIKIQNPLKYKRHNGQV